MIGCHLADLYFKNSLNNLVKEVGKMYFQTRIMVKLAVLFVACGLFNCRCANTGVYFIYKNQISAKHRGWVLTINNDISVTSAYYTVLKMCCGYVSSSLPQSRQIWNETLHMNTLKLSCSTWLYRIW